MQIKFEDFFEYSEKSESGLVWKIKRSPRVNAGDMAGWKAAPKRGRPSCWKVELNNKAYAVHRVIYEMCIGRIEPGNEIDHIDRNPLNNHISNLRQVSHKENSQNQSPQTRSKTGITGVLKYSDGYRVHLTGFPSKVFRPRNYGEKCLDEAMNYRNLIYQLRNLNGGKYTETHGI